MIELVRASQFREQVRAILLQGIAVGGFNVVDVRALAAALDAPVLVIMRRPPDLAAMQRALFSRDPAMRPNVRGARRKWLLIQQAGAIEQLDIAGPKPSGLARTSHRLWVQRVGLSIEMARRLVASTTLHGQVPEPLRLAHIIAGGVVSGRSRGRA